MSTLTDMTLMEMGNFIGRHYSTISESIQLITDEIAVDKALEKQINDYFYDCDSQNDEKKIR